MASGDSTAVISIQLIDDLLPEDDETFDVFLANPQNGAELGSNDRCRVTIESNDDAHGVVSFASTETVRLQEPDSDRSDAVLFLIITNA